jgi:hypothetical protein
VDDRAGTQRDAVFYGYFDHATHDARRVDRATS